MSANIPTSNTVIKHNNASDPGSDHEEVLIRGILGTKEFDRLQNISQLGGVRYVFTNATHNRAEHSKRVFELAGKLSQSEASCDIVDKIYMSEELKDLFKNAGLDYNDIQFIKALIMGKVVNNQYNGIDVKLWAYLKDDTEKVLGSSISKQWIPNYSMLHETAAVMDFDDGTRATKQSHIVYHQKAMCEIHKLFSTKEMMHRRVYQHADANAIEMLILSSVTDLQTFLNQTDQVVLDTNPKLKEKVEKTTEWYKCVAEKSILVKKSDMKDTITKLKLHLMNTLSYPLNPSNRQAVAFDIVEYKDTADPQKVLLYNDDNSPFTMDSVQNKCVVLKELKTLPAADNDLLWNIDPYYDHNTDKWYFSSKKSFDSECLKLFEHNDYAECTVRVYQDVKDTLVYLPELYPWRFIHELARYFMYECKDVYKPRKDFSLPKTIEDDVHNNRWLERECASFMLKVFYYNASTSYD
eukprot:Em0008g596a